MRLAWTSFSHQSRVAHQDGRPSSRSGRTNWHDDDGNPRPFFVVTKNLTVANYGDLLAGLRIDNIAVEHVFLVCVSAVTFTTPHSARCSGCRAIVRGCLEMARVPHPAFESRRSRSRPKGHKTALARSGRFGSSQREPRNKHTGAPLRLRRAPNPSPPARALVRSRAVNAVPARGFPFGA